MKKNIVAIVIIAGLIGWLFYNQIQVKQAEQNNLEAGESQTEQEGSGDQSGVQEGNIAPDFTLTTLEGEKVSLSDYRGQKILLNFWATWCPPCKAEMPHMQEFYSEQKDNGVMVLAVNLTQAEKSVDDVGIFVEDYGLTFPIPMDEKGTIGNKYKAFSIPTSYIIDTEGVIQHKITGAMSKDVMYSLINEID